LTKKTNTMPGIHLARVALYRGIQARVAKQLKVSESFVSRVALGKKKNLRVERALEKAAQAIEARIAAQQEAAR